MRFFVTLLILILPATAAIGADSPGMVEPHSIRAVAADGKHNAFTALARWKDQLWLSFRKGPSHAYGEADLIVMRSSDGDDWQEVHRVNALPDDRDPQFLATDDRLFLYDPALQGADLTTFVTYTDDGKTWSQPQPAYQPRYILWKPVAHEDRYYASAHLKSRDGKERDVHLIVSDDGLEWKKISTIRGGNWESETTIHFEDDGSLTAFLRQKYGSPDAAILTAEPPYKEWTSRPGPVHFSGHAIHTIENVDYFFSRTREGKETGTMIYVWADGKLHPYCKLPSGGDCSYPAAVPLGDEMLVSYYSSHEGSTNVYLALVPLQK